MRTALLIATHDTHFVELSRLALLFDTSREYKPVIWFSAAYPALVRDVETCRSKGWEFVLSFPPSVEDDHVSVYTLYSRLKALIRTFPRRLTFLFFFAINYIDQHRKIAALIVKTKRIILEYKPDILIACEENVGDATHIPIRICHANHIPTVIVPYTIANASEPAEFFYESLEHQVRAALINRWTAWKYPHWVYVYRGRELLRLEAAAILPMERSGFSPLQPWKMNSEESTFIAVENEHMLEYYGNEGLSEERLIVSGALYDDVLAESASTSSEMREKLVSEMGLQAGLPLLLCALPPSQFPRDCEFRGYPALVSFWMQTLSEVQGWNLIVRPHPRLTEKEVDELGQFGVKISKRDTASLVPLCDLYVASISATIRWAIACGKPVVNYDVYQMKYSDYENSGGVLTVFSKSAFKDTIVRLSSDHAYYEEIKAIQLREMSKWGRLDGKSSQRMLRLFDDVISGRIRRIEK